ncbi:MAG: hypothetical protein BroJett040_00510 [Oligoflexia bacterium]|nr:MAG: hypothetical protein BroJett040_00510 [Oligoflexia bacterium]
MSDIRCQLDLSQSKIPLTVGEKFYLLCEGLWPEVKPESYELRLDEQDQYKLKLLRIDFESKEKAKLTFTSYQTGQHQIKAIQLVSAENSIVLGDVQFEVATVIQPSEAPPEPYGPIGPFSLHLPLWVWLVAGTLFLALTGYIGLRIRRKWQKKKLVEDMLSHESAQSPYFHYHHILRQVLRKHIVLAHPNQKVAIQEANAILTELEKAYRLYLGKTLLIPTIQWSDATILKEIKSDHHHLFEDLDEELKSLFAEYDRAKKSDQNLFSKDVIQLIELSRKTVDHIHEKMKERAKKEDSL